MPDAGPPADAVPAGVVPVGAICEVSDLCAGGLGVCAPTGAELVCRIQCRAAEYPRCAPGSHEEHADIFAEGRELCFCVPGAA